MMTGGCSPKVTPDDWREQRVACTRKTKIIHKNHARKYNVEVEIKSTRSPPQRTKIAPPDYHIVKDLHKDIVYLEVNPKTAPSAYTSSNLYTNSPCKPCPANGLNRNQRQPHAHGVQNQEKNHMVPGLQEVIEPCIHC